MSVSDWLLKARQKLNEAGRLTDSLDIIEFVMEVEESFSVSLLDETAEILSTPRDLCAWLAVQVASSRVNERAQKLLNRIAVRDNRPELLASASSGWSAALIEAVVMELIRDRTGTRNATLDSSFQRDIFQ